MSLAFHLLDNFSTVAWRGLATCWRRTSERTLRFDSLHALVFCFTRFHKALGWSSLLALSNQQACVRPCCFTGRSRPLGTGFLTGSRCYLLICSFHHWDSYLRVPCYRLAPVDCFLKLLCHRQSSLLATRSFLFSPCTNFGPTDFCHLRRRSNLFFLICLFAIFGLNEFWCSVCFNSVTSNFGLWYADCRAFCPGPSSQEDRILAAWSKKKRLSVLALLCATPPSSDTLLVGMVWITKPTTSCACTVPAVPRSWTKFRPHMQCCPTPTGESPLTWWPCFRTLVCYFPSSTMLADWIGVRPNP